MSLPDDIFAPYNSRDKCPTRKLAAKTSQRLASMNTAGYLTVAAYFNYQWSLELEFAPHRCWVVVKAVVTEYSGRELEANPGLAITNSTATPAIDLRAK